MPDDRDIVYVNAAFRFDWIDRIRILIHGRAHYHVGVEVDGPSAGRTRVVEEHVGADVVFPDRRAGGAEVVCDA